MTGKMGGQQEQEKNSINKTSILILAGSILILFVALLIIRKFKRRKY